MPARDPEASGGHEPSTALSGDPEPSPDEDEAPPGLARGHMASPGLRGDRGVSGALRRPDVARAPLQGPPYDAVVLAGGGARRLGGRDKPGVNVGGLALIQRVAAAVPHAARLVVVGPERPGLRGAEFAREDPPGGGPVPALRAGLARVSSPWVALLAADLPFLLPEHVMALLTAAGRRLGAVLVDEHGREQWLTGVWRAEVLARALAAYKGRSLHGLLGPLHPVRLSLPMSDDGRVPWFDCDTIDDVRDARKRIPRISDER